jgi:hypothetical protein
MSSSLSLLERAEQLIESASGTGLTPDISARPR